MYHLRAACIFIFAYLWISETWEKNGFPFSVRMIGENTLEASPFLGYWVDVVLLKPSEPAVP